MLRFIKNSLVSPVYVKELSHLARGGRPFYIKLIFLCILYFDMLAVLIKYYRAGMLRFGASEVGKTLFWSMSYIELAAVCVITPMVACAAICRERESQTLDLLLITRLTPWNIVQDKGLSRLTFLGYLWMLSVPFMFGGLLFGGVEMSQILNAIGNIAASILFCGGVSMFMSTRYRSYPYALFGTYAAVALWFFVAPAFIALLFSPTAVRYELTKFVVAHVSPLYSMRFASYPMSFFEWTLTHNSWIGCAVIGVVTYIVSVSAAARVIRREDVCYVPKKKRDWQGRVSALLPRLVGLAKPPAKRAERVTGNPMAWKDTYLVERENTQVTNLLTALALIYVISFFSSRILNVLVLCMYLMLYAATLFFACKLAASLFVRERVRQSLDILLSTKLSGRDIILGAYWGVLRSSAHELVMLSSLAVIGALFREYNIDLFLGDAARGRIYPTAFWLESSLFALFNIFVFYNFTVAVGFFCSLKARSETTSFIWSFSIVTLVFIGFPAAVFLFTKLALKTPNAFISALSPSTWICLFATQSPFRADFALYGGLGAYALMITLYGSIAAILFYYSTNRFGKLTGRQK